DGFSQPSNRQKVPLHMATADTPADRPTEDTWQRIDHLVRRFEDAWHASQGPTIEDYLAESGPDRLAVLIELIHVDLERQLKSGRPARVEHYLRRFPELAE